MGLSMYHSLKVTLLFSLTFIFAGCKSSALIDNTLIYVYEEISPGFEIHDHLLYKGIQGPLTMPPEACLKLYARGSFNKYSKLINSPKDLLSLNCVKLKRASEALLLVRLFSSPNTFYLFDTPSCIDTDLLLGEEADGLCDIEDLRKIFASKQISQAKVTKINDAYYITRHVIVDDVYDNSYPLFQLKEKITELGNYKLIEKKLVSRIPYDLIYFDFE